MTRAVYTGHETLTFADYRDLETGRTLTAEPGRVYDVAPASGRPVPEIPSGWFVPAYDAWTPAYLAEPEPVTPDIPAEEAVDEPAGEPGGQQPEDREQPEDVTPEPGGGEEG